MIPVDSGAGTAADRNAPRYAAAYSGSSPSRVHFPSRDTFLYLELGYFIATMIGAFILRNPSAGCKPEGWAPAAERKVA